MRVSVRLFAAARAAVGVGETAVELPVGATLGELVAVLATGPGAGERAGEVLGRCSFLVDRRATRDRGLALADGARVDVLPPFAGG